MQLRYTPKQAKNRIRAFVVVILFWKSKNSNSRVVGTVSIFMSWDEPTGDLDSAKLWMVGLEASRPATHILIRRLRMGPEFRGCPDFEEVFEETRREMRYVER